MHQPNDPIWQERARILRALLAKTVANGCTEGEERAAREKAAELAAEWAAEWQRAQQQARATSQPAPPSTPPRLPSSPRPAVAHVLLAAVVIWILCWAPVLLLAHVTSGHALTELLTIALWGTAALLLSCLLASIARRRPIRRVRPLPTFLVAMIGSMLISFSVPLVTGITTASAAGWPHWWWSLTLAIYRAVWAAGAIWLGSVRPVRHLARKWPQLPTWRRIDHTTGIVILQALVLALVVAWGAVPDDGALAIGVYALATYAFVAASALWVRAD